MLDNHVDRCAPLVQFKALDQLVTLKMRNQTCFTSEQLQVSWSGILDTFHGEKLSIGPAFDFEYDAKASKTYLSYLFINGVWILFFDLNCTVYNVSDLSFWP